MTEWVLARGMGSGSGTAFIDGSTYYQDVSGAFYSSTVESVNQSEVRDTYTAKKLWVRVIINTATVTSTIGTRKNSGAGAQSVSITADATGTFEDTSNSDSLVSGDRFGYEITIPAETGSNYLRISLLSCLFSHAAQKALWAAARSTNTSTSADNYYSVTHSTWGGATTEANVQRTARHPVTLTNMLVLVGANGTITTFRFRKNSANGSQSVSVPDSTSGEFEDTSNSDSLASGDEADTMADYSSGSTISPSNISYEADGAYWSIAQNFSGQAYTTTRYSALTDLLSSNTATEADTQMKVRSAAVRFKNLYVYVTANSAGTARTVAFRQNGVSAISVSVPASTSGVFEETTTAVDPATTDLVNYMVDGASTITIAVVSVEQVPAPQVLAAGAPAAVVFTGAAPTLQNVKRLSAGAPAAVTFTGYAPTLQNIKRLAAGSPAAVVFTGYAPTSYTATNLAAGSPAAIAFTGYAATLQTIKAVGVPAAIAFTGYAPTSYIATILTPAPAAIVWTGYAPVIPPVDMVVEVQLSNLSGDTDEECGVSFRIQDTSNFLAAYVDDGDNLVHLSKFEAGVETSIATAAWTPADTAEFRVICQEDRIRVWLDRKMVFDSTDATFREQVNAGLFSRSTTVVLYENFYAQRLN